MLRCLVIMFLSGFLYGQASEPPVQNQQTVAPTPPAVAAPVGQSAPPQTQEAPPSGQSAAAPSPATGLPFDQFKEFSAIMVGSLMPGDKSERHVYRSGNMLRTESGQGLGYLITDLDKEDSYGLAVTGCMHDTHPYFAAFPLTESRPGSKIERVPTGKETVDGHVCQIEDVTISGGPLHRHMYLRFWEAEDLQGFPIKMQITKGPHAVIQYKNVVLGPQDPTLFMHPNSCKGSLPKLPSKVPRAKPRTTTPPAASAPSGGQQQ